MTEEDFTQCVEANRRDFVRIAQRLVGSSDAEDVVQDASLKVYQGLSQIKKIRPAIIVAIYWYSFNILRRRRFENDIFLGTTEDHTDVGVPPDQETAAILGEALAKLTPLEIESLQAVVDYGGPGTIRERQVHRDRLRGVTRRLQRAA